MPSMYSQQLANARVYLLLTINIMGKWMDEYEKYTIYMYVVAVVRMDHDCMMMMGSVCVKGSKNDELICV